jgi:hypothetical protein
MAAAMRLILLIIGLWFAAGLLTAYVWHTVHMAVVRRHRRHCDGCDRGASWT